MAHRLLHLINFQTSSFLVQREKYKLCLKYGGGRKNREATVLAAAEVSCSTCYLLFHYSALMKSFFSKRRMFEK